MTGNELKGLMADKALNELEFAQALGVSVRTVARWRSHGEKSLPQKTEVLIRGSFPENAGVSDDGGEKCNVKASMASVMPTMQNWLQSHRSFRNALRRVYGDSRGKIKNDSQFCRSKGLSRAQFSRVMRGSERPSPHIMGVLVTVCPDVYAEYAPQWLKGQSTFNEDYQRPISIDDLKYLIQVSEGLATPFTIELAVALLKLRTKPSSQ